jgi:hypothetical protein
VASLSGQVEYLTLRARRSETIRVEDPSVEDWLREDIGLREVVFSDLEGSEFWALPL